MFELALIFVILLLLTAMRQLPYPGRSPPPQNIQPMPYQQDMSTPPVPYQPLGVRIWWGIVEFFLALGLILALLATLFGA